MLLLLLFSSNPPKPHAFVSLPLQSSFSLYSRPCINKSYNKTKSTKSELKHWDITRGITTLTTAGTSSIALLLSFAGIFSVFFCMFRLGMMPAGGGGPIVPHAQITPVTDLQQLMTMLHNQVDLINRLTESRVGTNLDYYNQLNNILNHLNANLDYVRVNHYSIVPEYTELTTYVSERMRAIMSGLNTGRTFPHDVVSYYSGPPMIILNDIINQLENILSILDPTYAAV